MKKRNHVAIVLDCSSSMDTIRHETVAAYNGIVRSLQEQAQTYDIETTITLVTFASTTQVVFSGVPIAEAPALNYRPDGMTALFDGVGLATGTIANLRKNKETSYLVMVITDGMENQSRLFSAAKIVELIFKHQQKGTWTFAFQLPPGKAQGFAAQFGIPAANCSEWEATREGAQVMAERTTKAISGYYTGRASGQRASEKFFTDLSKVRKTTIKKTLENRAKDFKSWAVPKEDSIREFVEAKTKRPYVVGSAYYLLMKPEKVQARKDVLIVEKGKKEIWGGPEARALIGLPEGQDAKVEPGNHANYDIYVQSTSVNRKLVRGTRVLVDVTKQKAEKPTWDHTAKRTVTV